MKAYEIQVNSELLDDYIEGHINGIVYAITGMHAWYEISWWYGEPDKKLRFYATEEQANAVRKCFNDYHQNIFAGMREIE